MNVMFKTSNYGKPANKKWKTVSKFLSRSLPLYIGAVAIAPMTEGCKLWATFILSLLVATVSGLSEFTTEQTK